MSSFHEAEKEYWEEEEDEEGNEFVTLNENNERRYGSRGSKWIRGAHLAIKLEHDTMDLLQFLSTRKRIRKKNKKED